MIRHLRPILSTLLLALLLAGCVGTGTVPETRYYRLPTPRPAALAQPLFDQPLGIPRLQASGLYHERPLLYFLTDSPLDLRPYHYHFWSDAPALLIRDHLTDYLLAAHVAPDVVRYPNEARAPLQLYGRLVRFEREVSAERILVHVALEFTLETGDVAKLPTKRYAVQLEATDRTLHATVAAFGSALEQIYAQLIDDLRAASV